MTPRQDPFFAGSLELARGHEGSSSKGKGEPNHAVRSPEAHTPLPVAGEGEELSAHSLVRDVRLSGCLCRDAEGTDGHIWGRPRHLDGTERLLNWACPL